MTPSLAPDPPRATPHMAWVVFSGHADLPWLRLLRPGFRHCWAVLPLAEGWLLLDPMATRLEARVLPYATTPCLPDWYAHQGYLVVPARIGTPTRPAPWGPFSCVEAVKRLLGLQDRWVLTPWQLFCRLSQSSPYQPAP